MYCVKCHRDTNSGPVSMTKTKNGRHMARAKCDVCGTTKCCFVKGGAHKLTGKGAVGDWFNSAF